jgi:tetratricopeptide (TPR) repeat protein
MKILEEMGLLHIAAFLAGKAGYPLKAIAYFERAGSEWYGEILKILEEAPGIPDKKKLIATFLLKMEDYYRQRPSKQNEYVEKLCDLGQYRQALKFLDKVKEYLKAAILAKQYGEIELAIQFYLKQGGSWVRDAARLILSTTGDYKRALTILYREKERLLKLGRYGDAALLVRQTGAGSESEARELYQRELEKLEREKRYREAAELARKVEDKESEEIYTGIAEIVEESNKDL